MTARKREEAAAFLNNLAEFVGGAEGESKEALMVELRARGIDPDSALADFRRALDEHAPIWRDEAGKARLAALQNVDQHAVSATTSRAGLLSLIEQLASAMRGLGAPVEAGAYHREFREATDEDLRSLAADLQIQLESLKRKK